jgi:hypothetical protein
MKCTPTFLYHKSIPSKKESETGEKREKEKQAQGISQTTMRLLNNS